MRLFTPDTTSFNNYADKIKFILAWRISLLFSVVFAIVLFILTLGNNTILIPSMLACATSTLGLIYLYFTKKFTAIFWCYTIIGTFLVHLSINIDHSAIHFVDFIWMVALVILAFIGIGKKTGYIFAIIQIVAISYFIFFNIHTHSILTNSIDNFGRSILFIELILSFLIITYLLSIYIDLSKYAEKELIKLNDTLQLKNTENTVLMKEIHHRVKNNLQIITSLLRLQKSDLPENMQGKFDQAINRIMTMSIIHKKLYQTEEISILDTNKYLTELIDDILSTHSASKRILKEVEIQLKDIGLNTIVPLGLLLNELISNSFKHAFTNENNTVKIKIIATSNNYFKLTYSDSGKWIEPTKSQPAFGTELIGILSEQLDGDYTRNNSEYTFTLKNLDIDKV